MPLLVLASEPVASRRRVFFQITGTDGITPALSEAGGQPQILTDVPPWTNTGIGVLSAGGNGRYYADLTSAAVAVVGSRIETRYKSATTAEIPGDSFVVVPFDPYSGVVLASNGLDSITVETGLNARQALALKAAHAAGSDDVDPITGNVTIYAAGLAKITGNVRIRATTSSTGRTTTVSPPP